MIKLLPSKYIPASISILGIAYIIVLELQKTNKINIDKLYKKYKINKLKKFTISFTQFLIAINFLFVINKINITEKNEVIALWDL